MAKPPPPAPPPVVLALAHPWVFLPLPYSEADPALLETRAHQAREICRVFALPSHMVRVQRWPGPPMP